LNAAQLRYSLADATDRAFRASRGAGSIGTNLISAEPLAKLTQQIENIR
jgi:hypothetical protein